MVHVDAKVVVVVVVVVQANVEVVVDVVVEEVSIVSVLEVVDLVLASWLA